MKVQSEYERLLEELKNEVQEQENEIKLTAIEQVGDLISWLRADVEEIDLLQGKQRKVRIDELKKMLIDKLLNKTFFNTVLPNEYFELLRGEIIDTIRLN